MSTMIVTAAAGARDQYQIPLALQESGLLARHITDQYTPDPLLALLDRSPGLLPPQVQAKLRKRHRAGLPSAQVHCSRAVALRLAAGRLLPPLRRQLRNDQEPIGRSALNQARRSEAALLLYAGYAHAAFTGEPPQARRRGLVQYHPHITRSAEILRADIARFPDLSESLQHLSEDERDPTNLVELELADVVLCCSSFTAATCRAVGVPEQKLRVIPYGIDLAEPADPGPPSRPPESSAAPTSHRAPCRFLFVGTGIHRKGLHHLLLAWHRAGLRHSELWIVSRRVDREIRTHFDPGPHVIWRHDVSDVELERIYASTPVFVLPSLIEGFGYVYLEALARGCYCIGTANTALPDLLAGSSGCGAVVEAGAIEELAEALRQGEARHHDGLLDRSAITAHARRFPWSRFRQNVVELVRQELVP